MSATFVISSVIIALIIVSLQSFLLLFFLFSPIIIYCFYSCVSILCGYYVYFRLPSKRIPCIEWVPREKNDWFILHSPASIPPLSRCQSFSLFSLPPSLHCRISPCAHTNDVAMVIQWLWHIPVFFCTSIIRWTYKMSSWVGEIRVLKETVIRKRENFFVSIWKNNSFYSNLMPVCVYSCVFYERRYFLPRHIQWGLWPVIDGRSNNVRFCYMLQPRWIQIVSFHIHSCDVRLKNFSSFMVWTF